MNNSDDTDYRKGRGAQINPPNHFLRNAYNREDKEAIDDWSLDNSPTAYIEQMAKTIVHKVESPDIGMPYSMNAYGGCEHGCIYCYARNTHEYLGYSAGLDFERKIIVKKNAPQVFRKQLMHPGWKVAPIMMSGNTDCYQPAEQRYRLTRRLLEVCASFNQPVGIITKNARILKDKDILLELAKLRLVTVMITITSLNERLRSVMEPRTSTAGQRLKAIEELSNAGIRAGVMLGPLIPGLNDHEIPHILQAAAKAGAVFSAYTFVRLNGAVKLLFYDWLHRNFPGKADKVWHSIEQSHNGKVNDSRWGLRMRGEGPLAEMVEQQFKKYGKKYGLNEDHFEFDTTVFRQPVQQGKLF